jgi:hypothetical protein
LERKRTSEEAVRSREEKEHDSAGHFLGLTHSSYGCTPHHRKEKESENQSLLTRGDRSVETSYGCTPHHLKEKESKNQSLLTRGDRASPLIPTVDEIILFRGTLVY